MKIGPREQIIIAGVVVVVVLVAIVGGLILPQISSNSELDQSIVSARSEVDAARGLLAVRVQSKDRASTTDAKWLRLADLVPESPDLPSLIVELQDAAFASGVQLTAVTPAAPTAGATYYTIPIQLTVIGTWPDTVDYLQRLLKLNRGVRIVQSSSARTTNDAQQDKENMSLPDYAPETTILVEAYMIPSATSSTTPAPAPPAGAPAP
jgi:Tfp pilus assembly protein PilO